MRSQALLLAAGAAAPELFVTVLLVLGAMTPGYSHERDVMSLLGAQGAPHALAMNILGFGLLAGLTMLFALGLLREDRGLARAGAVLVLVAGAALLGVALAPCEPGCAGEGLQQQAHNLAARVAGGALALGVLGYAAHHARDKAWGRAAFALACVVVMGLGGALLALEQPPGMEGLAQRLALAPGLLWAEVTALVRLRAP